MSFAAGDTVTIPKGTMILEGPGKHYANQGKWIEGKRASKVRLVEVDDWSPKWYMLISKEDQDRLEAAMPVPQYGARYWLNLFGERVFIFDDCPKRTPETDILATEIKAKMDALYGDYIFATWGTGLSAKHCLVSAVEAATATVKAPKEATITKRRLLVPGSKWSFPSETPVRLYAQNGERERLINLRHPKGGWLKSADIAAMPGRLLMDIAVIPAGTKIKILDKPSPDHVPYGTDKKLTNGSYYLARLESPITHIVPLGDNQLSPSPLYSWQHRGDPLTIRLPYSLLDKHAEPESIPEDIVWTLRDRATGLFFGGWESILDNGSMRQTNTPKMSVTFSGSKKYKNLSALKASIMDFTGYMAGIEQEGYVEEWVGSSEKKINLPDTWEAVAIDKTTNSEKRIEDVVKWYAGLLRLRGLTVQFGSAVRTVYKKVEGKGYEAIVVFKSDERWEDLGDRDKRLIAEAMENAEGKPPSAKNEMAQAYAVKSQMDASLILLAYQGTAICKAFDIATLAEIVPAGGPLLRRGEPS